MLMNLIFKLYVFYLLNGSKAFIRKRQARNNICEPTLLFCVKQLQKLIPPYANEK